MFSLNSLFILYKATSPSNKIYIGITCESLSDRIAKHLYTAKSNRTKFSKAINKYGIDNIKFEILFSNLNKNEAIQKEKEYIKLYDSYRNGYNSTLGGEGAWGYKWDKEHHKKIHEKKFKFYNDPEWREKKSQITKASHEKNPELRQKCIEALLKYKKNPDPLKEKIRIEKCNSKESKIKASLSAGAKPFNVYSIKNKSYVGTFQLRSECAKLLNINHCKISACLNNNRKQHKGYLFKLIEDPTVNGINFNDVWLKDIKRKT